MKDKNGIEIRTGMIVEISNAYFKNDNGLYFVDHSPGDPSWNGNDHCLKKITKKGKLRTCKYNICFWPIGVYVNNWEKTIAAKEWNAEHAEIEVKSVSDMSEVIAHFNHEADCAEARAEQIAWNWGENSKCVKAERDRAAHYREVVARISV